MPIPSTFRTNNTQLSSMSENVAMYHSSVALRLPNILSIIFSFLSQHTIQCSVKFVCKQWFTAARHSTRTSVHWRSQSGSKTNYSILLDRLDRATDLQISFNQLRLYEKLVKRIETLRNKNQLHISRLVLNDIKFSTTLLLPMLSLLSNLTDIIIDRVHHNRLHIGMILAICAKLQSLHIKSNSHGVYYLEDDTTPLTQKLSDDQSISDIRNLTVIGMRIKQSSIEGILEKCPILKTLKLVVLAIGEHSEPFDRPRLYSAVTSKCRQLKYFHFSVYGQQMSLSSSKSMMQAFLPTTNSFCSEENQTPKCFPPKEYQNFYLDTISIMDKDLNMETSKVLLLPFLSASFSNVVTTLEITPSNENLEGQFLSETLHNFLCSAPNLLHLLAPTVSYFAEYLDMSCGSLVEGYFHPRSCSQGRLENKQIYIKKDIWACRKLLTLHLKFTSMTQGDSPDYPSPENARIMFGYIAKVCPNIGELVISRKELNIKLSGGLCHLSRLRRLQNLKITTATVTALERKDIEWMDQRQSKVMSRWANLTSSIGSNINIHLKVNRVEGENKLPLSDGTGLTVDDLIEVGSNSFLKESLRQIEQKTNNECCWPVLEFLSLNFRISGKARSAGAEKRILSTIYKIRPLTEIKCKINEQ